MTWCGAHGILGEQKNEVMAWVNAQPQFNQCMLFHFSVKETANLKKKFD